MGNEESTETAPSEYSAPKRVCTEEFKFLTQTDIYASTAADVEEASKNISEASSNINLENVSHFVSEATTTVTNDLSYLGSVAVQSIDEVAASVSATLSQVTDNTAQDGGKARGWKEGDGVAPGEGQQQEQAGQPGQSQQQDPDAIDFSSISQFFDEVSASVAQGVSSIDLTALSNAATEGINTVAESLAVGVEAVINFADEATKELRGEEEAPPREEPQHDEEIYTVETNPWKEPDDLLDNLEVEDEGNQTYSIPEIGSDEEYDDANPSASSLVAELSGTPHPSGETQ